MGGAEKVKVVSLAEWVRRLEKSANDNYGFGKEQNPGVKLLDFYKSLKNQNQAAQNGEAKDSAKKSSMLTRVARGRYVIDGLMRDSQQAAKLPMVGEEWVVRWMKQWAF